MPDDARWPFQEMMGCLMESYKPWLNRRENYIKCNTNHRIDKYIFAVRFSQLSPRELNLLISRTFIYKKLNYSYICTETKNVLLEIHNTNQKTKKISEEMKLRVPL